MDVYLNGQMVAIADARVSVEDAGFTHAVGLFETMSAVHGRAFRLGEHVRRLADSAKELGLARALDSESLAQAVKQTLEHNGLENARVRLTVTAGEVSLLKSSSSDEPPASTVLVVATEPVSYDAAYFGNGIMALIADQGANPFDGNAGHKTLSYWQRLRTLRQAAAVGAGEAIWLNIGNHLASGAVSNVFLVKDEILLTPIAHGEEVEGSLRAPVLPGVTRAAVMEIAERIGLGVERRMLDVNDLLDADEVFLTNSSWHVLPVTRVEKDPIHDGQVGPITRQLRKELLTLIDSECGGGSDEATERRSRL